jgi:hypothetical protein
MFIKRGDHLLPDFVLVAFICKEHNPRAAFALSVPEDKMKLALMLKPRP